MPSVWTGLKFCRLEKSQMAETNDRTAESTCIQADLALHSPQYKSVVANYWVWFKVIPPSLNHGHNPSDVHDKLEYTSRSLNVCIFVEMLVSV